MQVPDEIRKCVVFIGFKNEDKEKPGEFKFTVAGTGFIIGVPALSGGHLAYIVTAKHVIEESEKRGIDPNQIPFRINRADGQAEWLAIDLADWRFHSDDGVDVAVAQLRLPSSDGYDFKAFPWDDESMADTLNLQRRQVGIGEELFIVGLFTKHHGASRNFPIIRAGHIAAMPEEPVRWDRGRMMAYLIEARSIGGVSGSPVFVYLSPIRLSRGQSKRTGGPPFILLGLMHGHWGAIDFDIPTEADARASRDSLNTGIAVVVPIDRVLEILKADFGIQEGFMPEGASFSSTLGEELSGDPFGWSSSIDVVPPALDDSDSVTDTNSPDDE